ncbi:hypothetical protein I79_002151 [Cricetulus griseus]|uniref:Uncharacterized protein n=1 Tax=Cricetulus griseus TaxID=10029 RepID=G3GWM4_CRIGR|nr:hypothetical protein I79_002151 [Cricetulus griseus]
MLSIRIDYYGHKAAPSWDCLPVLVAGQGRASWRDYYWLILVAEDLSLSNLSWAQLGGCMQVQAAKEMEFDHGPGRPGSSLY